MNWKSYVSAYFTFTRKERVGVLTLLLLIIAMYALPYLGPTNPTPPVVLDDSLQAWVDSAQKTRVAAYRTPPRENQFDHLPSPSYREPDFTKGALFAFDPNTLDVSGWIQLGLRKRTAQTIINYRNKGGRFHKKEDLQKIWGLPAGFYERVVPYISIENNANAYTTNDLITTKKFPKTNTYITIDINTADTSEWKKLPGIGSRLANRIVNFRSKLGGFLSIEQVGTTFGLPDSTFQMIVNNLKLGEPKLSKIKINTAAKEELSAHPYINWKLANAIVAYRQQHGPFKSKEDLEQLMILDENTLEHLLPYLQFD